MTSDVNTQWKRPLRLAILIAAAIHAVALLTLSIPVSRTLVGPTYDSDLLIVTPGMTQPRQTIPDPPEQPVDEAPAPQPQPIRAETEVSQPAMSSEAPLSRTIPPTTLNALTEPTQSLIVRPAGIGRRAPVVDARRLAITRAESLLTSRLASLPGAGAPKPKRPIAPAEEGGVTVVIPWQGFLPADRYDEVWRANRCDPTNRDDGGDKPGEAEARRAQC